MKRAILLSFVLTFLFLSCGDSKIEVKSGLQVIDTYPSNGAEIDPFLSEMIVFFSSRIDETALKEDSFLLELVGEVDTDVSGAKVSTEISRLSDDKTAVYILIKDTPLTAGSIYRLTIKEVKSVTGDSLKQNYFRFFFVKSK